MSSPGVNLTPEQERELGDFLVSLDDEYLTLDLSRQHLHNNYFSYVRDEAHAGKILHHFRDRHVLAFVEKSDARWRWVRVHPLVDALLAIEWMGFAEKHRKSTEAVQALINCSPQEAERIWKYVERAALVEWNSDYHGQPPEFKRDSQWRWERVLRETHEHHPCPANENYE
jgi:hypothetical protein